MHWPPPPDWPNRDLSRQVHCAPHRWHVQEAGNGTTLLLLHGAGASTHSFRDLIGPLAESHHVAAVDLPGQGLTQLGARHRCGLDPMAEDLAALIRSQGWQVTGLVGHSAGGALALRLSMVLDRSPPVIGLNAALGHFKGLAGVLFPAMAKLLSVTPFTADVFSRASATPDRARALIAATGSKIDSQGVEFYRRLMADRDHVDATLLMMAQWSLDPLLAALADVTAPTLLLAGDGDRAVPSRTSDAAAARMPDARCVHLPQLGHLAHEEAPDEIADLILDHVRT